MTTPAFVREANLDANASSVSGNIDTTGLGANGAIVVFIIGGRPSGSMSAATFTTPTLGGSSTGWTELIAETVCAPGTSGMMGAWVLLNPPSNAAISLALAFTGDTGGAGTQRIVGTIGMYSDVASVTAFSADNDGGSSTSDTMTNAAGAGNLTVGAWSHGSAISSVTSGTGRGSIDNHATDYSNGCIAFIEGDTAAFSSGSSDSNCGMQIKLVGTGGASPAAPVTVTVEGTGNSATSTTTLAFNCGDSFAVGDVVVVCIAADNNGTNGVTSLTSVTDAKGNTYTLIQATYDPGVAAAGQTVGIAYATVTTALVSTDQITVNFSPATVAKCAVAWKLHPDTGNFVQFVTSGTTAGSATGTPTVTTATVNQGDVVIGVLAAESNGAVTADADTTNGNWTAQTTDTGNSGTSATSSRVASQAKIVTAVGTQTYNPTLTSCDNLLAWAIFTPAFDRPVIVNPVAAVNRASRW